MKVGYMAGNGSNMSKLTKTALIVGIVALIYKKMKK